MKDGVFDGKYKILKVLGRGGMGTVYLAENVKLGTQWAIKEISKKTDFRHGITVEPDILKKLNHPLLPRIFDVLEDEESFYIIVDFIEGVSLDRELERLGRFPEETVVRWSKQICEVLTYLHNMSPNPIIYRDMKPSNIMLSKDGSIRLIDFGIAREYKKHADNDTVYIGTRGYAAPEQYGSGQTNIMTDIYSLGITLHHLLTGKNPNDAPFEIKPVRYYDKDLSSDIESIILKCTKQDPSERYQSVRELIEDLNNLGKSNNSEENNRNQNPAYSGSAQNKTVISFKKLVLAVWSNCEFACELAYAAARSSNLKVLLLNLDYNYPGVELCFNLKDRKEPYGTDIFDAIEKKEISEKAFSVYCSKRREVRNLYIFDLLSKVSEYEQHRNREISNLIEFAYANYDLTIAVVNKSVFDSFTKASLIKSDFNIIAASANMDTILQYKTYMFFMNEKYGVPVEKTRFVAYEYKNGVSLSQGLLRRVFPEDSYIGCIHYREEKEKFKNGGSCYVKRRYRLHKSELEEILSRFNIIPQKTAAEKLTELASFMLKALHKYFGKPGAVKSQF